MAYMCRLGGSYCIFFFVFFLFATDCKRAIFLSYSYFIEIIKELKIAMLQSLLLSTDTA